MAFLWHTTVLPSRCSQDHLLGLCGLDGELVIRAGALAGLSLSSVFVGIVKDQEVSPAHALSVEVQRGLRETRHEVFEWDEELAIVLDHISSLLSQIICPRFGFVREVTFVRFRSPRISDLHKFDFISTCVLHLYCSQKGKGVVISDTICLLFIV